MVSYAALMPTQKQAADAVLEMLQASKLVLLEGLSGVGKTSVIGSIEPQLSKLGGVVIEPSYNMSDNLGKAFKRGKPVVIPVTPQESYRIEEVVRKKDQQGRVVLQAMAMNEILMLMQNAGINRTAALSLEEIASTSMGVPLLARALAAEPQLTSERAAATAASYLESQTWNNPALFAKYLQIQPPSNVIKAMHGMDRFKQTNVYAKVWRVLQNGKELAAKGIWQPSPFFTSAASIGIYNQMVASRDQPDRIDIFSFQTYEQLTQVSGLLGITPKPFDRGFESEDDSGHSLSKGTADLDVFNSRFKMFYAEERKMSALFSSSGAPFYVQSEFPIVVQRAEEFRKRAETGDLRHFGLKPASSFVYFHKHDHHGNKSSVEAGWMMESLLQQLGISYVAENHSVGKAYAYNPQTQDLTIAPLKA